MVFYKLCLIKSKSAVTNYNSSTFSLFLNQKMITKRQFKLRNEAFIKKIGKFRKRTPIDNKIDQKIWDFRF